MPDMFMEVLILRIPLRTERLTAFCRKDLLTSMLPKYEELLKYDLSILVFSGDVDAIVPVSLPPSDTPSLVHPQCIS